MKKFTAFLAMTVLLFTACDKDEDPEKIDPLANAQAFITNYANLAFANYSDALADAKTLNVAIQAFIEDPSATTQQSAKDAWLEARESYGTTEAFRFAGGPIDEFGEAPEGALNAWPLDEAYVDYVDNNGTLNNTGLINDGTTTIDKSTLEGLNEAGGEANISIGYHAIEFLLWGQDNTAPSEEKAGQRSHTDFIDGGGAGDITNETRRANYLAAVSDLLIDHLEYVVNEWDPNNGSNFRTSFLASDANEQVKTIIQSLAIFSKGELAGERMIVAYTNKDQEDEHSCFSDNTHRDIILNQRGVSNIYKGSYSNTSGTGLKDLVAAASASINDEVLLLLDKSATECGNIHVPFDLAISDDAYGGQVLVAANELKSLGDKLVEAGSTLGFTISAELPE